jgi:glycosyltransferase involved in cell wall biosynthesis
MSQISVVIPAHNRAHLIGETLRSLLAQTVPAQEIIVVDDGSTDATAAVAAGFGGPVKVIRQPNAGPAAARNTGLAASSGEFIHFFDSDDLAAPNKHEVQLAALEATGADIAIGPWVQGRFVENRFVACNQVLQQRGLPAGNNLVRALLTNWSIVPHSALFRRSIVEKAGGFPDDLFVAEDQFMFLACLLAGARVVPTPGTIEFYRLGDGGKITESREWVVRRLREWARFLIKARAACLKTGIEPLRWFGYRQRLWQAWCDLRSVPCQDQALLDQLQSLSPGGLAAMTCRWHRQIERWRGGLQQRLTGGRAAASFRMGPITPEQRLLLGGLGYSFEAPRRLSWRSGKKG